MVVLAAAPDLRTLDADVASAASDVARDLLDGGACTLEDFDCAIAAIDHQVRMAAWRRGRELVELVDVLGALRQRRDAVVAADAGRRRDRFHALGGALARLRECGSLGQLLAAAPGELARCGLDRVVISHADGDGWQVAACHVSGVAVPVASLASGDVRPSPARGGGETEALRRRCVILATARLDGGGLMEQLGARSYVVAPVIADGAVIALVHADATPAGRDVDEDDREIVAVFAEALGHAAARAGCEQRMAALRGVVRGITDSVHEALDAAACPELDLGSDCAPRRRAMSAGAAAPPCGSRLETLLTRRELEVLGMMADGETNRQIATRLVLSEGTIKSHVKSILRKLHAANRADAVARYVRLGQLPARG